jgi:hypothetical protein
MHSARCLDAANFEMADYGEIAERAIFVPSHQKNRKKTDRLAGNLLDFA